MKLKWAFLTLLSLVLLSTGEAKATKYAKAWWAQSNSFTPPCDSWYGDHDSDMIDGPQSWLYETIDHTGWDYVTSGNVTYAEFALSNDYVTRGRDHYTTLNKGFDYADAVFMGGLHGAHTLHGGKWAWGFLCSHTYEKIPGLQTCGAWMDQMDFGDDNGSLDIEWLHLSSCRSLWKYHVTSSYSGSYHQWSQAFDGLHSITGFEGVDDAPNPDECGDFAEDAFDNIKDAWLSNMINWAYLYDEVCVDYYPYYAHRACPAWITYDETTADCQYTMNYDDYTTPVGEPPGQGGNIIRLRARWTSCRPC